MVWRFPQERRSFTVLRELLLVRLSRRSTDYRHLCYYWGYQVCRLRDRPSTVTPSWPGSKVLTRDLGSGGLSRGIYDLQMWMVPSRQGDVKLGLWVVRHKVGRPDWCLKWYRPSNRTTLYLCECRGILIGYKSFIKWNYTNYKNHRVSLKDSRLWYWMSKNIECVSWTVCHSRIR